MAQVFEVNVRACYADFADALPKMDLRPVPIQAWGKMLSVFRRLRSTIKLDIDVHSSFIREVDAENVDLLHAMDSINDPYVEPEEFVSGEEEGEEPNADRILKAAWKRYSYSLHQNHFEPLIPISEEAYRMFREMVKFMNEKVKNAQLDPLYEYPPSVSYGDILSGKKSTNTRRPIGDEELRVYLTHQDPRGDEPWFKRIEGVDAENPAFALSRLCHGLLELLDLKSSLGWKMSPWKQPDENEEIHGLFITGSLIAACLRHNRSTKNIETAQILYPPVYTVMKDEKSFRAAFDAANGVCTVKEKRRILEYPTAGDTGIALVDGQVFAFDVVDGVDIDIEVCCNEDEFDSIANQVFSRVGGFKFPSARLVKEEKPNTYVWCIRDIPRTIQMYRVKRPGRVFQHHVAPARGMFFNDVTGKPIFHVTPTCWDSIGAGECLDIRYVMTKHSIGSIVKKYTERGFKFTLPICLNNALERWYDENGHPMYSGTGIIGIATQYSVLQHELEKKWHPSRKTYAKLQEEREKGKGKKDTASNKGGPEPWHAKVYGLHPPGNAGLPPGVPAYLGMRAQQVYPTAPTLQPAGGPPLNLVIPNTLPPGTRFPSGVPRGLLMLPHGGFAPVDASRACTIELPADTIFPLGELPIGVTSHLSAYMFLTVLTGELAQRKINSDEVPGFHQPAGIRSAGTAAVPSRRQERSPPSRRRSLMIANTLPAGTVFPSGPPSGLYPLVPGGYAATGGIGSPNIDLPADTQFPVPGRLPVGVLSKPGGGYVFITTPTGDAAEQALQSRVQLQVPGGPAGLPIVRDLNPSNPKDKAEIQNVLNGDQEEDEEDFDENDEDQSEPIKRYQPPRAARHQRP